jgi:hypothetical protein
MCCHERLPPERPDTGGGVEGETTVFTGRAAVKSRFKGRDFGGL